MKKEQIGMDLSIIVPVYNVENTFEHASKVFIGKGLIKTVLSLLLLMMALKTKAWI